MPGGDGRPDLVVFYGRGGTSEPERLVDGARQASTRQLFADAATGLFRRLVLVTNDRAFGAELAAAQRGLLVEWTPDAIDFGAQLRAMVERLASSAVVYVGGGSAPLLGAHGHGVNWLVASVVEPGRVCANNSLS